MKLFLDTNVVIDFCVERVPFYESVAGIIELASRSEVALVASSLTVVNTAGLCFTQSLGLGSRVSKTVAVDETHSSFSCR